MQDETVYVLSFGVSGGVHAGQGARCRSAREIEQSLETMFADPFNVFLLGYGANLTLDVYRGDERIGSTDLRPLITVRVSRPGCADLVLGEDLPFDDGTDWEELSRQLSDFEPHEPFEGATGIIMAERLRRAIDAATSWVAT